MSALRIAIVGGGIGGLSAGLALLKAGFDVHVYEQAPRFGEIDAGLQLSPNASRLLHRLGLRESMERWSVRPLAVHQSASTMDAPCSGRRWDPRSSSASARRTTASIAAIWRFC